MNRRLRWSPITTKLEDLPHMFLTTIFDKILIIETTYDLFKFRP